MNGNIDSINDICEIDKDTGQYKNAQKIGARLFVGFFILVMGILYSIKGLYFVLITIVITFLTLVILSLILYLLAIKEK